MYQKSKCHPLLCHIDFWISLSFKTCFSLACLIFINRNSLSRNGGKAAYILPSLDLVLVGASCTRSPFFYVWSSLLKFEHNPKFDGQIVRNIKLLFYFVLSLGFFFYLILIFFLWISSIWSWLSQTLILYDKSLYSMFNKITIRPCYQVSIIVFSRVAKLLAHLCIAC